MGLIHHSILRNVLSSSEDASERLAACVWLSRIFRAESLQLAVEVCDTAERRIVEQNLIRRLLQVEHALQLLHARPANQFALVLKEMQDVLEVARLTTHVKLSEAIQHLPELVVADEDDTLESCVAQVRTYEEPSFEMLLKTFGRATERASQIRRMNSWLWEDFGVLDELSRSTCTRDAEKLGWVGDARCMNVLLLTRTPGGRTSAGGNFAEAARILGENYLYLLTWLHPEHARAAGFVLDNMRADADYRMRTASDYLCNEA